MNDTTTLHCDHCGELEQKSTMFHYQHLPYDVESANKGESASVCSECDEYLFAPSELINENTNEPITHINLMRVITYNVEEVLRELHSDNREYYSTDSVGKIVFTLDDVLEYIDNAEKDWDYQVVRDQNDDEL